MIEVSRDSMLQCRSCHAKLGRIFHRHACYQSVYESTGEAIPTTHAVNNPHLVFPGMIKFRAVVQQCTPTIVAGTMAFAQRRSDIFKSKLVFHLPEYILKPF